MPGYFNVPDFIKIGIMSVGFIWLANKGLDALNLQSFKA